MLSDGQKRYLKNHAHALKPVIILGNRGLTEAVDKEIDCALRAHELIKVKLGNRHDTVQAEMIEHIVSLHQAEFVQKIGHIATFYRQREDDPTIILPGDGA